MPPDSTPAKGGGMSLYANLLDPSAESTPGTISRAPVVFKQSSEADAQPDDSAAKKQQLNAASLRFQPTKRPQLANQKPKPKPTLPKATAPPTVPAPASTSAPSKSTLADWAATEDDDFGYYMGEKRQRGGRKKRKKNREERSIPQNWDDIYDPSRPNNYEAYRHSDEKISEVREWKDRLYAHRMRRSPSMDSDSDYDRPVNRNFAPPPSFAPPPNLNDIPPPPPASVPDDASGEDAFARRAHLVHDSSNNAPDPGYSQSNPPPPPEDPPAPPPPPGNAPPPRTTDIFQPASATISRAPVRYTLPPAPADIPASEAELEEVFAKEEPPENENDSDVQNESNENAPRSLRPGQKGFAERLLSKYGWTKGSGLGADGSGIAKPLQVKVEKRKKRPDSEGGGFVTPAGRGTIIGGKRKGGEDTGKFGPMSEVIILLGMLSGMDLDAELSGEGGGLMQEIGEECSEKYGSVERVYIARDVSPPIPVFVKFTSPLSALRAVNALEGRIFNGNPISARFFDPEKFEQGIYVD
ncbi:hypothetical protein PENSTE_c012G04891 [Penicillium steckii]|uniref:G-patch domain-containing protein n=1 Tax=Penicillium steckii TaxID=303698 RepID=A0A1V6T4F8_9EURO|nr:hypothetical protein PENSTE_c012G04891 [Penicillium steckii]